MTLIDTGFVSTLFNTDNAIFMHFPIFLSHIASSASIAIKK